MIAYGIKFKQKLWFTDEKTGERVLNEVDRWHNSKFGVATLYDTPGKAIGVATRIHKEFDVVEVELN